MQYTVIAEFSLCLKGVHLYHLQYILEKIKAFEKVHLSRAVDLKLVQSPNWKM